MSSKRKIDLQQHRQFKKSWKTIIRLVIYTVMVIVVCVFMYYRWEESSAQKKQPETIQAEDFEIDI